MGLMSRMSTVVKAKMNRLLDNAEDPNETLDYAYAKQREMLTNVKRGIVEMVTTKRRLQLQADKVRSSIVNLDNQARQAMAAGREDLARLALQRKQTALMELDGLDEQVAQLELEQQKLTNAEQRLTAKVESFRSRKEIIKAQYSAAQAQVRIGSALSGISEEMGDVQLAVERAEDKTQNLRAKAGAIDELADSGVLDPQMGLPGGGDMLSRELAQLTASQNVEDELAALRGGGTASGGALPSGGSGSASAPSAPADPLEAELAALRASSASQTPPPASGGSATPRNALGDDAPRLSVSRPRSGLPPSSSPPAGGGGALPPGY